MISLYDSISSNLSLLCFTLNLVRAEFFVGLFVSSLFFPIASIMVAVPCFFSGNVKVHPTRSSTSIISIGFDFVSAVIGSSMVE